MRQGNSRIHAYADHMHIFLKDLLKNLSTVTINDSFYAMTGTDQSTVQQTWILQSASTHGRILHLYLIMCCFAFLFLATALFQKNMMEGIRYILSIMHSARHFMTSEEIYQRGENANLWKPMKNFWSFLWFVNLPLSSIPAECNSTSKNVHKVHICKFILHNKLYLPWFLWQRDKSL